MKNFVVSDIHDHYDLLMAALQDNGFEEHNAEHRLIVCGDGFYSGPQPGELFRFLQKLSDQGRLVFIYGNHDIELLDSLKNGTFTRKANRTCAELLVQQLTGETGLTDDALIAQCNALGFTDFLSNVPVWYYETEHYIFTHGFIPSTKRCYNPNWRNATHREWRAAARSDAMLLTMKHGICEPGKKIVCGHFSAARCYLMKDATPTDWANNIYKDVSGVPKDGFRPFFGDTFIALDQSVKKTGFMNCIVLETA